MTSEETLLAYHRRDARAAALLHALLLIGLIVLWFADRRFGFLRSAEVRLLQRLFGG